MSGINEMNGKRRTKFASWREWGQRSATGIYAWPKRLLGEWKKIKPTNSVCEPLLLQTLMKIINLCFFLSILKPVWIHWTESSGQTLHASLKYSCEFLCGLAPFVCIEIPFHYADGQDDINANNGCNKKNNTRKNGRRNDGLETQEILTSKSVLINYITITLRKTNI